MIVAEDGGIIDDLISYRFSDTKFLVVPNAGNTDVVWEAFNQRIEGFDVKLNNESLDVAMIALQGPNAAKVLVEQVAEESKRSEEHTSELQSRGHLVCRLLLEKKKTRT